jgi:hypothetical protein
MTNATELTSSNPMTIERAEMPSDLTLSFLVEGTPEAAYAAINNVRGWWHETIDGETDRLGAEWVFHNEPIHVARFRVTELVPGRRVRWLVLENDMSFISDSAEWLGNEVVFDIAPKGNKTEITFTQVGLVPDYECYDVCSSAWTGYVKGSLRQLIATGTGVPTRARG